jgi:geranylgeranyl pyrophosphate synthase
MPLSKLLQEYGARADLQLQQRLPGAQIHPARLHQAMRYAVFNGGKRVRPALVYLTGTALEANLDKLDAPACAVELIHAYSLVHDDLPSMDNDDLRRGLPTCHKAFDEATAILAGDALQTLAFQVLSQADGIGLTQRLAMLETLALAAGSRGMAGGQALDMDAVGKSLNIAELEDMHIHKTGMLIRASVKLGALTQLEADSQVLERLDHYAKCIGLAFQVQDDILDVEGETATLGKTTGHDSALNKPTYPALLGLAAARQMARDLLAQALDALEGFGPGFDPLRWMASYIVSRDY